MPETDRDAAAPFLLSIVLAVASFPALFVSLSAIFGWEVALLAFSLLGLWFSYVASTRAVPAGQGVLKRAIARRLRSLLARVEEPAVNVTPLRAEHAA
jgi:hypothetical protein